MLSFFAMLLPVLLLFCGLAIDVNFLQNAQSLDQYAADAASTSAALELQSGSGNWAAVGRGTASLFGLTDGSQGATVKVTQTPPAGQYAGRNDAVQVFVSRPSPTIFMRFVQSVQTSATATALLPPCLLLRGYPAINMVSSTLQTACPVYANGSVSLSGSNTWSSSGILLTSNGSISGSPGVSVANGTRNVGDPLASVAQPRSSNCRVSNFAQNGGTVTLQPGTYCAGMTLRNSAVTLSPGLYVITGGAHWTGGSVQGQGVTLFFTGNHGAFGQFLIDGGSAVNLTAAVDTSTAAIPGVIVFGDRAWQAQTSADFRISNASVQTQGIWYTTGTGLLLQNATLSGSTYLGLDVDSLTLSSSTLRGGANLSSLATGNPFQFLGGLAE